MSDFDSRFRSIDDRIFGKLADKITIQLPTGEWVDIKATLHTQILKDDLTGEYQDDIVELQSIHRDSLHWFENNQWEEIKVRHHTTNKMYSIRQFRKRESMTGWCELREERMDV